MKLAICTGGGVLCALCVPYIIVQEGVNWIGVGGIMTAYTFGIAFGFDFGIHWHSKKKEHEREVLESLRTKITEHGRK